jgi:hypothetical protein
MEGEVRPFSAAAAPAGPLARRQTETRCEVHGIVLETDTVPIAYGLYRFDESERDARKKDFPNACSFVLGGCVIRPSSPRYQTVEFCPTCRAAERAWFEEHPETIPRFSAITQLPDRERKKDG